MISKIDWITWVQKPGGPPSELDFHSENADKFKKMADTYVDLQGHGKPDNYMDYVNEVKDANLRVIFNN